MALAMQVGVHNVAARWVYLVNDKAISYVVPISTFASHFGFIVTGRTQ